MSERRLFVAAVSCIVLVVGCASAPPVGMPNRGAATDARASAPAPASVPIRWPVKTAEHIDLWLHAFAMVSDDSAAIPLYRRGYRDSMTVVKNRANVLTSLDTNRSVLSRRLRESPTYLQAQFLPLDMANWDVLRAFGNRFLEVDGDPKRVKDRETGARIAQFAAIFPSAADRQWLRTFLDGVADEQLKFFADERARAVRSRVAVITAVDSLWQRVYRPRFERFLTNTGQRSGDIVLALPVGAEGRSGVGRDRQTVVVVPLPERVADAREVILVFAHEVTASLVGSVIGDNTTPAEQRAGVADRYVAIAQVRAGAMLLERVAPELLDAYLRYYLAQVGGLRTDEGASLASAFAARFALPNAIHDALQKQIEIVLGGI